MLERLGKALIRQFSEILKFDIFGSEVVQKDVSHLHDSKNVKFIKIGSVEPKI